MRSTDDEGPHRPVSDSQLGVHHHHGISSGGGPPNSSGSTGGPGSFGSFQQLVTQVNAVVTEPHLWEENKAPLEVSVAVFLGTSQDQGKLSKPQPLQDVEMVAFLLSTAFSCPHRGVQELFQRELRQALEMGKVGNDFLSLLPQEDEHNTNDLEQVSTSNSKVVNDEHTHSSWDDIPPSLTVPNLLTSPSALKTHGEDHDTLLGKIFAETMEVSNFSRIMSVFPPLLQAQYETWQFLMEDAEGPLPIEERLMVAIIAASRHHCEYFTKRLFLRALTMPTFPQSWLTTQLAPKFEAITNLIATLAHRPWMLSPSMIVEILDADCSSCESTGMELEPWNHPSLVHAVCIASNVISVCGFATLFQIPFEVGTAAVPKTLAEPNQVYLRTNNNVTLKTSSSEEGATFAGAVKNYSKIKFNYFRPLGEGEEKMTPSSSGMLNSTSTGAIPESSSSADINITHGYNKRIKRVDKKKDRDNYSVNISNFSWESHASTLIESHYVGGAQCFSQEKTMYEHIVHQVETSALRFTGVDAVPEAEDDDEVWRAVTVYIHNLFGVTHPDFDYGTINKLLDKEVKRYIHKATAVPEETILEDFDWTCTKKAQVGGVEGSPPQEDGSDENVASNKNNAEAAPPQEEEELSIDPVLYVVVAVGAITARREATLLQFMYHFDKYLKEYQ